MASGDLLRKLFRGYARHDDAAFRAALEDIVEEERAKNHRLLASDLERILMNGNGAHSKRRFPGSTYEIPKDRERDAPLLNIEEFSYDWDRLVLSTRSLGALKQVTEEFRSKDILATAGLKPKQRVLFYGPPGCGKSLAARVMAGVLSYPLVTVRFDAIVSSYLGETAANLRKVFDFIQSGQWVVLFDEFDAIGKDRDNPFEHGELKRVVNTLLQLMDAYRGDSLLIAATNHEGLLDPAIWRRFESVIHFDVPAQQDVTLLLRLFLRGFDSSRVNFQTLSRRLKGATGADIELVAIQAARYAVLSGRSSLSKEDFEVPLTELRERFALVRSTADKYDDSHDVARKRD